MGVNLRKIRVCMLACYYKNASVANYTKGLISPLENKKDLKIRLIASHCKCLRRFPKGQSLLINNCSFLNCPYLSVSSRKLKSLNSLIDRIPQRLLNLFRGLIYLKACKDCEIIHFHQSSSYAFGFLPLISLILLSSRKKIVTVHSTDTIQKFNFLYKLYNRVDKVIVHSKSMETHLIEKGVSSSRIVKVFHSVDIPHIFGLERTKITFMGAPEERKGILTILDALKILKRKRINIKVSIYGFYSDHEKKKTELQAISRKVDDCLIWGGRLSENEFDKKLQESLFTLAVYNVATSGSNLVTRAMANATPVIASDIGGLREYLDGGGIFLPLGNPEALAETIESLLKNPELLEELGSKGRKRALQLFSREEIAKKTASIYRSLISENRGSVNN